MCSPVILRTGFIPHPSPAVTPSLLGRLPFGKLGYPSFVFSAKPKNPPSPPGRLFAEQSRPFPTVFGMFIKNTVGADIIRPVFASSEEGFFITAGASPCPTLNYRRGAPMCAPVILAETIRPVFDWTGLTIPQLPLATAPFTQGSLALWESLLSLFRLFRQSRKIHLPLWEG